MGPIGRGVRRVLSVGAHINPVHFGGALATHPIWPVSGELAKAWQIRASANRQSGSPNPGAFISTYQGPSTWTASSNAAACQTASAPYAMQENSL